MQAIYPSSLVGGYEVRVRSTMYTSTSCETTSLEWFPMSHKLTVTNPAVKLRRGHRRRRWALVLYLAAYDTLPPSRGQFDAQGYGQC